MFDEKEKRSAKRVLMQVLVAQCIALRTFTRSVEVSIPSKEDRKNFWPTINTKLQKFQTGNIRTKWIAERTSDPEVAGSNPAEDETKFFLVHKESKIRKLQSGYIEILSTYLYLTKMKNKKLFFIHSINTAVPQKVQTITKTLK